MVRGTNCAVLPDRPHDLLVDADDRDLRPVDDRRRCDAAERAQLVMVIVEPVSSSRVARALARGAVGEALHLGGAIPQVARLGSGGAPAP